jgi:hypothetical protein
VVRLTVVTAFGLVGTVATGFLGMNLYSLSDLATWEKIAVFIVVFIPVTLLTLYTIVKSKRLSDFLEALSDERLPVRAKIGSFLDVWRESRVTQHRPTITGGARAASGGGCARREPMRGRVPPCPALPLFGSRRSKGA